MKEIFERIANIYTKKGVEKHDVLGNAIINMIFVIRNNESSHTILNNWKKAVSI